MPPASPGPKRVLLVEDERHIIESLVFVLEREGFAVTSVLDGEAAMLRLRSEPPDVLILDIMLPRMNGLEVLKQVRADAALRELPVVVLSAKGQPQDRRRAEEIGVQAFMTKPFANTDVVDAVRRVTGTAAA
ncbi:response regulator transcription factor [Usitatibacter palustris]|uniref:Alkaline phosphatase synthesis transcriptional regulatory protein PhoP n=1 Tax=Usitatibacter palustris TaxID=2732487 RepID=A0A6M4H6S7_9PROT|nr:response regulator [Usitatibacter palustris]QJR14363.1 Alkaline phosphatase synthesis transcriptional regulatory protein PhoP [Usitatibacter palustris]